MHLLPEEAEHDGVTVRRWRPDDAPVLHRAVVASIEHLRPWMAWIRFEPMTVDARRELIVGWEVAWQAGGEVVWGVWRDGEVVGGSGLHRRLGPTGLEIGYWVHVDHVGRGIATALSHAATTAAFTVPGIDHVEIHHDVANLASARVPEKLGFTRLADVDATGRDAAPADSGVDGVWRVTREAWLAR